MTLVVEILSFIKLRRLLTNSPSDSLPVGFLFAWYMTPPGRLRMLGSKANCAMERRQPWRSELGQRSD